jgi:creatinine amidohydrolase
MPRKPDGRWTAGRRSFLASLGGAPLLAQTAPSGWKHRIWELPGTAIAAHVKEARCAILPLGSVEYHGPSGPIYTDTYLAEGIADRLGQRLKASVFPCVNYTHCPAHTAGFQGSISVKPEIVTQLLQDVLRGVSGTGFKKIFVLNGHSGNNGSAQMAISQVTSERKDVQVLIANWWETLTVPLMESLNIFTSGNGGRGHGGPLEMSSAAVFAPAGSVVPGAAPDLPAIPRLAEFPNYLEKHEGRNWPAYSGKLSEISKDRGEKLVAIATDKLAALAEEWLKDEGRPGNW